MSRPLATLILIFASIVWGFAFIAQKSAMESLEPLSFIAARYLLGGLAVLPIALLERRSRRTPIAARDWRLIGLASVAFFLGSWLQQQGLITTTATNGGFLTGLYVLFVPAILLIGLRIRPHPIVWASTFLALFGLYLLNGARLDQFAVGDALIIGSALFWAVHVLLLGHLVRATARPIFVSAAIFLLAGVYSALGAAATETVTLEAFRLGWVEIAYVAFVSTAIGFTCQAIGQQHVPPANAAIIMSAEALFAALGGALILGERLPPIGYAGAALIFLAIVLVETVPLLRRPRPA